MALAYLDWQGQEAGIAAALSRDAAMIEAYLSKDCYITFGVQAGLLPDGATEETHGEMRGRLKITWLSTQYGTGYYSLAERLDCAHIVARNLLASHRRVYNTYWKWSDNRISRAYQYNCQSTVFGWTHTFKERPRVNSVRNFPIQGNGSEMMRLAACLMTENGIDVCAPVHDAFLITAPSEEIEAVAARALTYMGEASAAVLNGFGLKTDKQHIFKYPEYYRDPKGRGEDMVARVEELLKLL
jgi:DNA polymerase I-like protein with 3'-5' exonuclease and polymerase domains